MTFDLLSQQKRRNPLEVIITSNKPSVPLFRRNGHATIISIKERNITLQPINLFKRIARSMTTTFSVAGEILLSPSCTSNSNNSIKKSQAQYQVNLLVSTTKYFIPTTYKSSMKTLQKEKWEKACQKALSPVKQLNVYQLVPKHKIKGAP